jgi:hypothetical protein
MKKWKEKLIRWLGGYTSAVVMPQNKIITSTAPLIRLKVSHTIDSVFQYDSNDIRAIKRELAEKIVDNIVDNHMMMIDTYDNEIVATLYVADIRKVG